ncbi:unnamed protein product [Rangifer tarandus platyrhynchus]|uniref:Uncharacterized protein n=1 Tax=Rangifer tarandus platyrhynchus TaxID=3082113 RepID=A0ABN8XZP6_RANTA|nr:unnamed protein product [Rangifer tarandus platyrhynchus]
MPSRSDQTDTRNTWGSEHHGRPPPPRTHAPSPPSLGPLGSEPPSTCFPEDSVSSQVSHEASWRETLTTAQHGDWVYVTELFHLSVVRQQSFTQKRQRLWRASLSPPHGGGPGTKLGARCVGSLALRQPVPGTGLGSKEYGPVPGLLTGATGPSEDRALRIWGETEARLKVGAGPAWRKCLPGRRPGRVPGQEAGTSVNRSSVPATTSGLGERRRLPARFPANVGPDNGPLCPVWAGCQAALLSESPDWEVGAVLSWERFQRFPPKMAASTSCPKMEGSSYEKATRSHFKGVRKDLSPTDRSGHRVSA